MQMGQVLSPEKMPLLPMKSTGGSRGTADTTSMAAVQEMQRNCD